LVVEAEQGDYVLHIRVRANPAAHPTGVGQNVVWFRSSRGDELVSRRFRKGEVGKMIAVDVAQLDTTQPKLDTTVTVRTRGDTVPRGHLFRDPFRFI